MERLAGLDQSQDEPGQRRLPRNGQSLAFTLRNALNLATSNGLTGTVGL